jgi:hypothetical protein
MLLLQQPMQWAWHLAAGHLHAPAAHAHCLPCLQEGRPSRRQKRDASDDDDEDMSAKELAGMKVGAAAEQRACSTGCQACYCCWANQPRSLPLQSAATCC